MAISDFLASSAAAAGSLPESKATVAAGTLALTAFNGEVGNHMCSFHFEGGRPGASTCAEPPPEIMAESAFGPMMAMEWSFARSKGRVALLFFRRTVLCS